MELCCSGLASRRLVPLWASKNASGRYFQEVMAASCRKDRNTSPSLWKVTEKQVCKWEIVQSLYFRTCKLFGVLVSCTKGNNKNISLISFNFSSSPHTLPSPSFLPSTRSNFLPFAKNWHLPQFRLSVRMEQSASHRTDTPEVFRIWDFY